MGNVIELNQWGLAVWRHATNKNLFVERPYRWCDVTTTLDESESRLVVGQSTFSGFDFTGWIPVTVEEFKKVTRKYNEIYG